MAAEQQQAQPKRRRVWLRRAGGAVLLLLAILIAFHRPIFFHGTRYFIIRAAKQQKLALDYKMSGSIFTTLTVTDLHAKPTEPGPVERLEIRTLNLRYTLWGLIRKGLPGLLKEIDLRDADVIVNPAQSVPPKPNAPEQQVKFPALFPERLNIAGLNLTVRQADGDFEMTGVYLSLEPTTD